MLHILSLLNLHFFTKNEQINLFFLSKLHFKKCIQNDFFPFILTNLVKHNKIHIFIQIIIQYLTIHSQNELIEKLYVTFDSQNILGNIESVSCIEQILQLNRLSFLQIITDVVNYTGDNYYNLLFSNPNKCLYNQKPKLNMIRFLETHKYDKNNKYPNINMTSYMTEFLDIWKYNKNDFIFKQNNKYLTPLHSFSKIRNIDKILIYINYFIEHNLFNVNTLDVFNRTPLTYAIENLNIEYSTFLFSKKCNITNIDKYNCNILHYLCIQNNSYDNNMFFNKIWNLIKYNCNIEDMLLTENIRNYTPIDYLLIGGRYNVFKKLYNFKYIKCKSLYIEVVQKGFSDYCKSLPNNKNIERSFQFDEYLKLTKLLIRDCMDFKLKDFIHNVKDSDEFYKVCKYLG